MFLSKCFKHIDDNVCYCVKINKGHFICKYIISDIKTQDYKVIYTLLNT